MFPTIAMLGGGNMGRALLGGLLRRGAARERLAVGDTSESVRRVLHEELGVRTFADNALAVHEAEVVVLAVKPQEAGRVLAALSGELASRPRLLISVAAGIQVRSLERWCGSQCAIVRAMPNRPALVGAGVTGLYAHDAVAQQQRALATGILEAVGHVVWLKAESDLDVVTALSGSGPAYFFLLAELLAEAAVRQGLEPAAARALAVETLHGAGALAHAGHGDLARLRAEVTSKGGTTEAALRELAGAQGIGAAVERAVAAATQRSRELARDFGELG